MFGMKGDNVFRNDAEQLCVVSSVHAANLVPRIYSVLHFLSTLPHWLARFLADCYMNTVKMQRNKEKINGTSLILTSTNERCSVAQPLAVCC